MTASMNWEEARDYLKKLRDEQSRKSAEIIDIWESVLSEVRSNLGDDLWPIYEQVCIAACDCGRDDISVDCIHALRSQFPKSLRVKMLHGMCLESIQKYNDAREIYEDIVKTDETNTVAVKRTVAMYRSTNKIKEAISTLNQYLKDYMADYESWNELCDLYLMELDYTKAAFCMEECIMSNPHNHAYYQKYAEIKYTQGGIENMELARKYFGQAIKLHQGNVRALYGFFLAASYLATNSKTGKKENVRYADWAAKHLKEKHKQADEEASNKDSDIVTSMLENLKLSSHSNQ